jgi:hypothetical protein
MEFAAGGLTKALISQLTPAKLKQAKQSGALRRHYSRVFA